MVGAVLAGKWLRFGAPAFLLAIAAYAAAACSTADLKQAPPAAATPGDGTPVDEEGNPTDPGTGGDAGGRPKDPAGVTLAMTSAVSIQVEPTDSGFAILNAIKGAKKSVHMTMYLLTSDEMINALIDQKKAGKDVKVILNQTFPSDGGDNGPTYTKLKAKGVPVVWASSNFTFTHAKTILIDGEKALIMTMNLTYSSPTTNREYIATDSDPQDVADLESIFTADYAQTPITVQSKLVVSPAAANAMEPRTQLKTLIDSATTSLAVEAQSLSDETLVDAIIAAHQAKVDVKVVIDLDTSKTPAQTKTITKLKDSGVPLRALHNPDIHAKAIVADGARTFVGSQNLTATALDQNREVGVLTNAASESAKVQQVIEGDFAKGEVP